MFRTYSGGYNCKMNIFGIIPDAAGDSLNSLMLAAKSPVHHAKVSGVRSSGR